MSAAGLLGIGTTDDLGAWSSFESAKALKYVFEYFEGFFFLYLSYRIR